MGAVRWRDEVERLTGQKTAALGVLGAQIALTICGMISPVLHSQKPLLPHPESWLQPGRVTCAASSTIKVPMRVVPR